MRVDLHSPGRYSVKAVPEILKLFKGEHPQIKASLALTGINARFIDTQWRERPDAPVLAQLLKELTQLRSQVHDDLLQRSAALTECRILAFMGRQKEALARSREIDSPDAAVFLDLHK